MTAGAAGEVTPMTATGAVSAVIGDADVLEMEDGGTVSVSVVFEAATDASEAPTGAVDAGGGTTDSAEVGTGTEGLGLDEGRTTSAGEDCVEVLAFTSEEGEIPDSIREVSEEVEGAETTTGSAGVKLAIATDDGTAL